MFCSSNSNALMKSIRTVLPAVQPHWYILLLFPNFINSKVIYHNPYCRVGDGFLVRPVFADFAFTKEVSPFLMFDYGNPRKLEPDPKGRRKGES